VPGSSMTAPLCPRPGRRGCRAGSPRAGAPAARW
jgi:hypothetical protein